MSIHKSDEIILGLDYYIAQLNQIAEQATKAAEGLKQIQIEYNELMVKLYGDANHE